MTSQPHDDYSDLFWITTNWRRDLASSQTVPWPQHHIWVNQQPEEIQPFEAIPFPEFNRLRDNQPLNNPGWWISVNSNWKAKPDRSSVWSRDRQNTQGSVWCLVAYQYQSFTISHSLCVEWEVRGVWVIQFPGNKIKQKSIFLLKRKSSFWNEFM